jgi:hypothetical protein
MWDLMAKWLQAGGCLPNHPELKTDLCTPTYSFNAAGKLVLEGKDEIKKRGLRSTDLADALALTFAERVTPKGLSIGSRVRSAVADYDRWLSARTAYPLSFEGDYDPFAEMSRIDWGELPWLMDQQPC